VDLDGRVLAAGYFVVGNDNEIARHLLSPLTTAWRWANGKSSGLRRRRRRGKVPDQQAGVSAGERNGGDGLGLSGGKTIVSDEPHVHTCIGGLGSIRLPIALPGAGP
jgi:hypothetical protein